MSALTVTMLGCGSSGGVPFIGCGCEVCTSKNLKNNRTRVSLWLQTQGKSLIIDTSPDFRQQALREGIKSVDAVLYTHDHADHTHGIDDIRSFNWLAGGSIPAFADAVAAESLRRRFSYIFKGKPDIWYRGAMDMHEIALEGDSGQFEAAGVPIKAIRQQHGKGESLGFRLGDFAYSTDTNAMSDAAFDALRGVKVWIVDCLRISVAPTHAHLEMTLEWIARVQPELAILTHMSHEIEYEALSRTLPSGVVVGYDGLRVTL
jgi:phosphoribosyl 1,2-cyclic phosphate phosphodiesterase